MAIKTIYIVIDDSTVDIVDYSPLASAVSNLEYDGCTIIEAREKGD